MDPLRSNLRRSGTSVRSRLFITTKRTCAYGSGFSGGAEACVGAAASYVAGPFMPGKWSSGVQRGSSWEGQLTGTRIVWQQWMPRSAVKNTGATPLTQAAPGEAAATWHLASGGGPVTGAANGRLQHSRQTAFRRWARLV